MGEIDDGLCDYDIGGENDSFVVVPPIKIETVKAIETREAIETVVKVEESVGKDEISGEEGFIVVNKIPTSQKAQCNIFHISTKTEIEATPDKVADTPKQSPKSVKLEKVPKSTNENIIEQIKRGYGVRKLIDKADEGSLSEDVILACLEAGNLRSVFGRYHKKFKDVGNEFISELIRGGYSDCVLSYPELFKNISAHQHIEMFFRGNIVHYIKKVFEKVFG